MTPVIVQTRIVGDRSGSDDHSLTVGPDVLTLRQLLAVLVRHELDTYDSRRATNRTLRVLTPADMARGVATGRFGHEARSVAAAPPFQVAFDRAIEAFADGLYFVFLDDVQVEDLDAPLGIDADSTLRLVRLVALAGG